MAQRSESAAAAAPTSSAAPPRQLSPLLAQRRPSHHGTSDAVGGVPVLFTDVQSLSTTDPLLANHSKLLPAAPEHLAHALSKGLPLAPARKLSAGRKYSTATSRRTSAGSVQSARGGRTALRFVGGKALGGGNNADSSARGDDDDSDSERDVYALTMIHKLDGKRAQAQFQAHVGADAYEDGGRVYRGAVDRHGIAPAVTFTTAETPPSQAAAHAAASCGFCSSTNLVWTLRCAFCGSARMSDLAKKILDFAKFDRIAVKVEDKFKQASLVRAKTAIVMMSRTVNLLRQQMLRMMFAAWKGHHAAATRSEAVMHRLITIKDIQIRSNRKELAFAVWRGHVARVLEERAQRFAIAARRNELTRTRRLWAAWQTFLRMRVKEKTEQLKQHYEAELNETPNETLREIEKLKETLAEARKMVFAATNTILELLHLSLRKADHDVLKTLQLAQMHPTTVGSFFGSVHGPEILEALNSGHVASASDEFGVDDDRDDAVIQAALEAAQKRVERMHPSESLIEWLNFQRKRAAETDYIPTPEKAQPREPSSVATTASGSNARDRGHSAGAPSPARMSVKLKPKDKKHEFKAIKGLQDLRTKVASPGVMLKLLCHTSVEAQIEHQRIRASEGGPSTASTAAAAAAESSTTTTSLTPSALLQLKIYFKMVHRILRLPPDIVSRDAFTLNDFDSLYAYSVYLYLFHPNYVAPGLALSPRHHLSYAFFEPQWDKIKTTLTDDDFDPFAQQQYYIFLAKIKRVNRQFLRFGDICRAVAKLAHAHQQTAMREAYNDFTRRVLGKDSSISVALEKETLASWVTLPASKLLALCDDEDELQAIERVFKDNVLELVKIFRIYGSAAGGKGILEQEFLKIMTKAGVTDKKNILRSHLQAIYQQARQPAPANAVVVVGGGATSTSGATSGGSGGLSGSRDDASAAAAGGGGTGGSASTNTSSSTNSPAAAVSADADDDFEDRGATPNEFFEALTRVAYHNFQKRRDTLGYIAAAMSMPTGALDVRGSEAAAAAAAGAVSGLNLLAFVTDLVVERVVPLTKKFQEQGLTFKKQMIHPDVQHVCKAQEKKLKRIFTVYSQKNRNPSSRGKLMDVGDFEGLLKDRRLVDALFPYGRIKQLVSFVQQDGDTGGSISGYDADSEFVFSEFVEALAAIAVYRNANPYLPLAKKLEAFFDENF
ncbi:hypothetical protein PybrP1_009182 [[Pythium] brassicae (nom. inval.)]|nr:hypothetical protein PybrP1_009182 [[Pythium] brassicae (nom. inval.)]